MNTFVAVALKHTVNPFSIAHGAFEKYLSARSSRQDAWISPNGRIFLFSCIVSPGGADGISSTADGSACVYDGIFLPRNRLAATDQVANWPLSHLLRLEGHRDFAGEGEFAVAWTDGQSLFCRSNGSTHNLYMTETSEFFAVSNRSACLLSLPGVSHDLDPTAVCWKTFQGYMSGTGTDFSAISKARNGAHINVGPEGQVQINEPTYFDLIDPSSAEAFASNPAQAFHSEIDRIADYMRRAHHALGAVDIDVPLSGGKDSRVILALLMHGGMLNNVSKVWTGGPLYSPEVCAAQEICKTIGYSGHEVRRSALVSSTVVRASLFLNTLNLHEGMLSLYDFCGVESRRNFRFQGHQFGLRAGRFSRCDTSSAENFYRDAIGVWTNPLNVLRDSSIMTGRSEAFFRQEHAAGAPVDSLGDMYSIFHRHPSWVTVTSAVDYCGGPISNPLLHGDGIRFAFSIPAAFRRSEVFQYLTLWHAARDLLKVPFAEQVWPDSVSQVLDRLGISEKEPTPFPYQSHPQFPNVRNPYVANIKLEYFHSLKPAVNDIRLKHRTYFEEAIDVDKFVAQQQEMNGPNFLYLTCAIEIYFSSLPKEYGSIIFDRTRLAALTTDLQSRIDAAASDRSSAPTGTTNQDWETIVERHEKSIATLVKEVRDLRAAARQRVSELDRTTEAGPDNIYLPRLFGSPQTAPHMSDS